jgi:hypothetical protein
MITETQQVCGQLAEPFHGRMRAASISASGDDRRGIAHFELPVPASDTIVFEALCVREENGGATLTLTRRFSNEPFPHERIRKTIPRNGLAKPGALVSVCLSELQGVLARGKRQRFFFLSGGRRSAGISS